MKLFRPTGLRELQLVLQRGLAAWPPRLPEQPIFYPVLNIGYAEQIARDWNSKSEGQAGYVTEFIVDDRYVARFENGTALAASQGTVLEVIRAVWKEAFPTLPLPQTIPA